MTESHVLDYIRRSPEPVSCKAIATALQVSTQNIDKYLRILKESDDVIVGKVRNFAVYSGVPSPEDEKVQPRQAMPFKPLQHHPSPLGRRVGSNDSLGWPSKGGD